MSGEIKAPTPAQIKETKPSARKVEIVTSTDTDLSAMSKVETQKTNVRDLPVDQSKRPPSGHDLNDDERTKSQKTQARAFDDLVSANLKLVRAVDKLVKIAYIIQGTQLFVLLVLLFDKLITFFRTGR